MRSFSNTLIFSILFITFISCQEDQTVQLDAKELLANLKELSSDSYEGRGFATTGNLKAQKFISNKFKEIGLEYYAGQSYIQNFEQTFSGRRRQRMYPVKNANKDFSNVPDTTLIGGNVVGVIKGKKEKAIVISGHFDHLGIRNGKIYNGADDDASGTAAVIAMAKYFKQKQPNHTLIFATVDAEEIGLLGAKHFVANHPNAKENIVLNINMDMIAHNDKNELYAVGLYHYPQLKPYLKELKSSVNLLFGHDPSNKNQQDWTNSSDHAAFHRQGIPFVYFGVDDHKDYHKPTDTFENINQEFYVNAVKLIIDAIENFDKNL